MRWVTYALFLIVFASASHADQKLLCEPIFLPVTLVGGGQTTLEALAVRPNRLGRFPLVVVVHGMPRGSGDELRAKIKDMSFDYRRPVEALAKRGYAVVSIMRRGFGRSDGPYAEDYSGGCNNRDPAYHRYSAKC
jgi:pimeloyl-ACP methyl ester carboxylesterase